jgi:hypothetical protein
VLPIAPTSSRHAVRSAAQASTQAATAAVIAPPGRVVCRSVARFMSMADQATEVPDSVACESTWLHRPRPDKLYVQFVQPPAQRSRRTAGPPRDEHKRLNREDASTPEPNPG